MELDSKDSEIEQLQGKLASLSSETASLSSGGAENEDELMGQGKRPQIRVVKYEEDMYRMSSLKMLVFV
jgi:hypothetical protein